MKIKLRNHHILFNIITITIFLYGCGNSNPTESNQNKYNIKQEDTTYITQSIAIPEYDSFDAAYSDGTDLYYAATTSNQDSGQQETAFYTLKQGTIEPEINFYLPKNHRVLKMTMDAEGNIYYIGYEENFQDAESNQIPLNYMLYKLNQWGNPLITLDLTEYTQGQEQVIIQNLAVDIENCIILSASNQTIFVFDSEGNKLFDTRADGTIFDMSSNGEKVFVIYNGINGAEIKEVDISAQKLSSKYECNISSNRFHISAAHEGNLLIATEESVYQYTPELGEIIKKFDWQTHESTGISAGELLPFEENGVLIINNNYATIPMKVEVTAFQEAIAGEVIHQEKTVLTLAIPFNHSKINAEVINFNKSNSDYKIEVVNYKEDYSKLYMEIMAGNGPDLLMLRSHKINQFSEKGLLENLNPYFENDKTLNHDEFLENILDAFKTNGYAYGMPIEFTIDTIVAKTSVVGETSGWNLDELITFTEGFPKEIDIFNNTSKSGVLRLLKYGYTDQLVNTNNINNPLNRELLVKMLEFSNQYKNDNQYINATNLAERIKEEEVILSDINVYGEQTYFGCSSLFGEPITFIGFPSEERNGNLIHSYATFGISSDSKHKDIAWEFISTLLSEDAQMRMVVGTSQIRFSVRKDVLTYKFKYALENYNRYAMSSIISDNIAEYSFTLGDMKDEDMKPVLSLIQGADTVLTISPDIDQIIEEEAIFYFNGSKPVEEVADVIENRIKTYVNESK